MSQKFIFFTILVLVVSALAVGGGVYYIDQNKVAAPKLANQTVNRTVSDIQRHNDTNKGQLLPIDLLEIQEQLNRDRHRQEELKQMIGELRSKQMQSEKKIEQRLNKINELKPLLDKSVDPAS